MLLTPNSAASQMISCAPQALVQKARAELLREQLTGDVMAELIPVAVAEFAAEAVQKNFMFVGVSLELRRKRDDGNLFAFAQRLEAHVRVENILRADAL